ncbi:hypothetical protein SLI_1747 [Streptomyces lividans 1326]|uniref:Uncharacterized protein n=1 Tax=Streptomyces lividans 1326 TaxID=1200984 RepID=A0A7U9DRH5_STRLI|nr:hypothetical protein SLI_1747 [Streptomyces lividans 1326]
MQFPTHAEVHGEVSLSLYVRTVRTIVGGARPCLDLHPSPRGVLSVRLG